MKWSGWDGDTGLDLYVAAKGFGDRQQFLDSQKLLTHLRELGIEGIIDIVSLPGFNGQRDYLTIINDPDKTLRLPFLVVARGCQTCCVQGYSGIEQIVGVLNSPTFVSFRRQPNQQYYSNINI